MIYSVWVEDDEPTAFSFIQGDKLSEQHLALSGNMHLVKLFDAKSPNDAMQQYYDWQGWGKYKPMTDELGNEYPEDSQPFDPHDSATQS